MENRQTVVAWVSQLIKDMSDKPETIVVKSAIDEKGLLITVYAPNAELGRLIGRKGVTSSAIRTIVSVYGLLHGCRVAVKLEDAAK